MDSPNNKPPIVRPEIHVLGMNLGIDHRESQACQREPPVHDVSLLQEKEIVTAVTARAEDEERGRTTRRVGHAMVAEH